MARRLRPSNSFEIAEPSSYTAYPARRRPIGSSASFSSMATSSYPGSSSSSGASSDFVHDIGRLSGKFIYAMGKAEIRALDWTWDRIRRLVTSKRRRRERVLEYEDDDNRDGSAGSHDAYEEYLLYDTIAEPARSAASPDSGRSSFYTCQSSIRSESLASLVHLEPELPRSASSSTSTLVAPSLDWHVQTHARPSSPSPTTSSRSTLVSPLAAFADKVKAFPDGLKLNRAFSFNGLRLKWRPPLRRRRRRTDGFDVRQEGDIVGF